MILVTVGTEQYPFNALMNWVEVLIHEGFIDPNEEVVVQYGSSSKLPDRVKVYKRLPESQFKALLDQARLVISHCGEGSVLLLESLGKPFVLVPRTKRFGEHVDDHQLEMADVIEKQGISVARSPGDLVRFLAEPKYSGLMPHSEDNLCQFLSDRYDSNHYKKIMVVCSSGGHFKYAESLKPFLEQFQDICWVTFKTPNTQSQLQAEKSVYWAHSPTNRNLPNLIRNLILAFTVLKQEQPDLVLSTGAGVAVPFLLIAKFFSKKTTVFVESKTRIKQLSLSARLLQFFSGLDRLIVRSEEIARRYKGTEYIGTNATNFATPEEANTQPKILKQQDTAILSTPTFLGILEAEQIKNDCQKLCELSPKKIVLDMSATVFIYSAGLGALVNCLKTANAKGIKLVLWSVQPEVMSVLSMAKLDNVFQIDAATSTARPKSDNKPKPKVETLVPVGKPIQRGIDVVVGCFGVFLTALLLIPIGICIKITSPGPIFSEQIRYGLHGKYFRVRKFRSTVRTVLGDSCISQITKFGHFLHQTHLDKLPLFWNVLAGDMTLVGPRASTLDEVDCHSANEWKALEVKPGISSEWESDRFSHQTLVRPMSTKQKEDLVA
ncbi:MAG: sugar transferase [Cyanobacteriota bacterium]